MKKYFAIFALVFASVISAYGMIHVDSDSDSDSVFVKLNSQRIQLGSGPNMERSIDFITIEACAFPSQGIVEVSLYNIGSASVSLINSNGQVVSSDCVQTDALAVVYLDTFSTSGTFYLEIVSDTWYAEGVVTF